MKKMRKTNENGITLIALVVTIIVLIILAGVSISLLAGENGILNRTIEAKEKSTLASEKEAIQLDIIKNDMSFSDDYKVGEKLYDRNISNGNKWKIIYVKSNQKIYGTNWIYIPKGTEIDDYGKVSNDWLVNNESKEVVNISDGDFQKLQYGDNLAITDGLILNVDIINMSDNNSWGEGVTLKGVEEGDGYGFVGDEIKLDGINDYIEIYTGNNDMSKGITFEFYGKLKGGRSYLLNKATRKTNDGWTRYSQLFRMNLESLEDNTSIYQLSMNGAINARINMEKCFRSSLGSKKI